MTAAIGDISACGWNSLSDLWRSLSEVWNSLSDGANFSLSSLSAVVASPPDRGGFTININGAGYGFGSGDGTIFPQSREFREMRPVHARVERQKRTEDMTMPKTRGAGLNSGGGGAGGSGLS